MKDMIKAQEMVVSIARDKVELARRKLQVAMQERKTQEKLKENAFEEFKHELGSEESKEVDELVSYRFGNGSGDN